MESHSAQQPEKATKEKKGSNDVELPIETSPYLGYDDLEDYKRKAYGTEGHQEPVERNAAGSTDAPTGPTLTAADAPAATALTHPKP